MNWVEEVVRDFDERMRNIVVFFPLFELGQKHRFNQYALPALGVAVMLVILEHMLRGDKDCTYDKIAGFLRHLIHRQYGDELSHDEALELTHLLVRDGLRNGGRPHVYTYPVWEQGGEKTWKFHLIELANPDSVVKDKTVRLKLSPTGLELLFKTKEMYNELQVSITQLYLRQQIQRGVFDGALRSVEELALAVQNEKERLRRLERRILRDPLQVAREKELERQLERINEQLAREQRAFADLMALVAETMEAYRSGKVSEKEEQAMAKIMRIQQKLYEIIRDHESLFTDKLHIQQLMNRAIEQVIVSAFQTRINFETEVLQPVVRRGVSLDALKRWLDPLFAPKRWPRFHLGRAFEEQVWIDRRTKVEDEVTLWTVPDEEALRREEEALRLLQREKERRLERYLLALLTPLAERPAVRLSEVVSALKEQDPALYDEIVTRLEFYPLVIQLHQWGEIPLRAPKEAEAFAFDETARALAKAAASPNLRTLPGFSVRATPEVIRLENGYVLSDFVLERWDDDAMA
ncbi:MAG TPA: hypothetical protein VIK75_02495 [Calditerricola sp.]